jgi:hypothetical protein
LAALILKVINQNQQIMKWFVAKIIFQIVVQHKNEQPQFDEQLRFIRAQSVADAYLKAKLIGQEEETTFINTKEKQVTWKFIDVSEIDAINEPTHGMILHSSITEEQDAMNYVFYIQQKAIAIQAENIIFA